MIEFGDQVVQLMNCLKTGAKNVYFPSKNEFTKALIKIDFFKRCFDNLNSDDFMKHCHFICSQIQINGTVKYFEGNLGLFYQLFIRLLEFMQQNNFSY